MTGGKSAQSLLILKKEVVTVFLGNRLKCQVQVSLSSLANPTIMNLPLMGFLFIKIH